MELTTLAPYEHCRKAGRRSLAFCVFHTLLNFVVLFQYSFVVWIAICSYMCKYIERFFRLASRQKISRALWQEWQDAEKKQGGKPVKGEG